MQVAIIGSGYVGLVSGACFADFGHVVCCVDKDPSKIARLRAGEMPIYEPGLAELVANNVRAGRLSFATELAEPVRQRRRRLHRGRHAVAARRRLRRSVLRLPGGARDRGRARRLYGGRHEIDGAGRHRRRGRAHHRRDGAARAVRRRLEPGVPARRRRHRRFQAARPHRHRHRGRARRRRS